jgi:hypothetical protein
MNSVPGRERARRVQEGTGRSRPGNERDRGWARGHEGRGGRGLRSGHGYPGTSRGKYRVAGGGPFAACPAAPTTGRGWKVIPRT